MGEDRHKLLLPLGERPVVAHVLAAATQSQADPVVVVLGHQAALVRQAIQASFPGSNLIVVENTEYRQGMSTSLRAGLDALAGYEQLGGAIVLLGDQPLVTTSLIDALIEARKITGQRIVAPLYPDVDRRSGERKRRRGNPVLFDASLFAELRTVSGDEGGRSVIERHLQEVVAIDAPPLHEDVDTWEAYQRVLAAWEQQKTSRN
jgi:molybdenum cofactor cytidylyltransferase